MVHIDHVFAHGRYFALLDRFLVHARRWLTTEALGRYLLNSMLGRPPDPVATKISLIVARALHGVPLRAQGNDNRWSERRWIRRLSS